MSRVQEFPSAYYTGKLEPVGLSFRSPKRSEEEMDLQEETPENKNSPINKSSSCPLSEPNLVTSLEPSKPQKDFKELLNLLTDHGYLTKYKFSIGNLSGQTPLYLFLITRLGDPTLVYLDLPLSDPLSLLKELPTIQMVELDSSEILKIKNPKGPSITEFPGVPDTIRMEIFNYLNYDTYGIGIISKGIFGLTERYDGQAIQLINREFKLQGAWEDYFPGNSVTAYPIIRLSELELNPEYYIVEIERSSQILISIAKELIIQDLNFLVGSLNTLTEKLLELGRSLEFQQKRLSLEIGEFTRSYYNLIELSPDKYPKESKKEYKTILKNLADWKLQRRRSIDNFFGILERGNPIYQILDYFNSLTTQ